MSANNPWYLKEARSIGQTLHIIGVVSVMLKFAGLVAWSWWLVMTPYIALLGIVAVLFMVALVLVRLGK